MPVAQIIQNQLTQDFANSTAWRFSFNLDMTFRIKVTKDWSFNKRFP